MNKTLIPFIIIVFLLVYFVIGEPSGPGLEYSSTETPTAKEALMLNTSGGSITTMVLNGTTQDPQWKAYVGNVTGKLALRNSQNYSIFDWALTSVNGEVYATRESSTVSWSNIVCAQLTHIAGEESALNIGVSEVDNIRNTFTNVTHNQFYTGTNKFSANECNYTTATYVDSGPQYSDFQEILLYDGSYIVYATLLSPASTGFDNNNYDFQMIVPEDETTSENTLYYFYLELS